MPMPDNVIEVINQIGEDDGSPEGIVFGNIHKVLTVGGLYPDVDSQDNSDNASDTSWEEKKHGVLHCIDLSLSFTNLIAFSTLGTACIIHSDHVFT